MKTNANPTHRMQKEELVYLPLAQIDTDPEQPRKNLGSLTGLELSIQSEGVLEPIIVSPSEDGRFRLVLGRRRYQAAQNAGFAVVPCIVRSIPDNKRLVQQLMENLQRKDLTPFEEGESYRDLQNRLGMSAAEVARKLGRTRSEISQVLSILTLPKKIREDVQTSEHLCEKISKSVLIELAKLKGQDLQLHLWEEAKKGALTVQRVRNVIKGYQKRSVSRCYKLSFATVTVRLRMDLARQIGAKAVHELLKRAFVEAQKLV